jgi:hypothetical protein
VPGAGGAWCGDGVRGHPRLRGAGGLMCGLLGGVRHWQVLRLGYGDVTDTAVVALAAALGQEGACPALRMLRLNYWSRVGDTGAMAFADALGRPGAFARLERLAIKNTAIGDAGAQALARVLASGGAAGWAAPMLTKLDLNEIRDATAVGREALRTVTKARPGLRVITADPSSYGGDSDEEDRDREQE